MAKKKLTKAHLELMQCLPHRFGWKWYKWAHDFYESKNKYNFLVAANQISKSSTQIRKNIEWATNKKLWPNLWLTSPNQFWYLYPTKPVATTEFWEKWVPEFLPRGPLKKDPVFGWEEEIKNKEIWAIHFNSGVSIYFKTYEQDVQNLQTGTCHMISGDEEMPYSHFQELRSRLVATNGYFNMVFTATLGQDEWRRTIEPRNEDEELFKDAFKRQVSMYDCLKYMDGSPSPWTEERIEQVKMECATEAEVQRRVYGRFVVSAGLKFPSFSITKNMIPKQVIPYNWPIYTGVDVGSGGEKNHPAAIVMVAMRPDYKFGIVFKGWRGDGVVTTSADILEKHIQLCKYYDPGPAGELIQKQFHPVIQSYDWHSKDFFTIASRAGLAFTPADKNRERGENLLNTLFKLGMLKIMDGDPELSKLAIELSNLLSGTPKTQAKDDFVDSLRYCCSAIPWDFDGVAGEIIKAEEINVDTRSEAQLAFDERRRGVFPDQETEGASAEDELDYWQSLVDG